MTDMVNLTIAEEVSVLVRALPPILQSLSLPVLVDLSEEALQSKISFIMEEENIRIYLEEGQVSGMEKTRTLKLITMGRAEVHCCVIA
jgi:hypothetical protein